MQMLPINPVAYAWFEKCLDSLKLDFQYGGSSKRLKGYFKPYPTSFFQKKNGLIRLFEDEVKDRLLFTAVHELAHAIVWLDQPRLRRESPHGKVWQKTFQELLHMCLQQNFFLPETEPYIIKHMQGTVFACSGGDVVLEEYFIRMEKDSGILLQDLAEGMEFVMGKRRFLKGKKLKKRFECTEIQTNRLYRIHPLVKVELV